MNELNNIIRIARESKRLKSKEVAKMVGVSAPHFCRIERGSSKPSIKTLKEICKVLDLDFRKTAKMVGYSENTINAVMNSTFPKAYMEKIAWDLSRLSNQDLDLVTNFIKQLPNLTNKEKNTIKFIVSYKDNASG